MSYDYVTKLDQYLALQLHVRLVKSDELFVVIGESEDVQRYKEVTNA